MVAASNESSSDVAMEAGGPGEVFLPLGEAMLIDLQQDLLHWSIASDTIMRRARRYNAALREKIGALL